MKFRQTTSLRLYQIKQVTAYHWLAYLYAFVLLLLGSPQPIYLPKTAFAALANLQLEDFAL
jgi:hypothetical protein